MEHDLLTMTRYKLSDIPANLGWTSLAHFVAYLKPGSALYDEVNPDTARWGHADMMLADIYDAITSFIFAYASANSKGRPKRPKPYPRPWVKAKDEKHIGSSPVQVQDFNDWWNSH